MGAGIDLNWQLIGIIGGAILFVIVLFIVFFFIFNKKDKKPVENKTVEIDNNKWVNALGGKENIVSFEAKGSRLIVNIVDNTKINKEELHELGVTSIIVSKEKATLVLKERAENICNLLQ